MKKKQIKNLQFSKVAIAKLRTSTRQKIKGGTEPISNLYSAFASQCGDVNCY